MDNKIVILMNEFGFWNFAYPTFVSGKCIGQIKEGSETVLFEGEYVRERWTAYIGSIWTIPSDKEHLYYNDAEGSIRRIKYDNQGVKQVD